MAGTTRIIGSLRIVDGKGAVRMEDRFGNDVEEVWSALTDPGRLARWLGDVEGDLRLGGEFRARFSATGWEGTGRIETCKAPQRLRVVTWGTDEPDEHAIEIELTGDGDGTSLVLEERGMPVNLLPFFGAGVQIHVEDLAAYLAGRELGDMRTRFDALVPEYRERAPEGP